MPELPVTLTLALPPELADLVRVARIQERARAVMDVEGKRLLDLLGLPGAPVVTIEVGETGGAWGRVFVNDVRCRFADTLGQQAWALVFGTQVQLSAPLIPQLAGLVRERPDELTEWLKLAVSGVLAGHPAALLNEAQTGAYASELGVPVDVQRLRRVLSGALRLGVSVRDRARIADGLAEHSHAPPEEVVEALLPVLATERLRLRMPNASLRQLLTEDPDVAGRYASMRSFMLQERGLDLPRLGVVPDLDLAPGHFAVSLNAVPLLPWPGLGQGECLVAEPVERTRGREVSIEGVAPHPAYGYLCARIRATSRSAVEAGGASVWTGAEYVWRVLREELLRRSWWLVDRSTVRSALLRVSVGYPALLALVQERIPETQLAMTMRTLAQEGVSVRNMQIILEQLLDAPVDSDLSIGDIRHALARSIAAGHTTDQGAIEAFVLAPELEELLRPTADCDLSELPEPVADRLLAALRAGAEGSTLAPCLLTTTQLRPALQALVANELPRVAVISYDDLPAATPVQASRIAFAG